MKKFLIIALMSFIIGLPVWAHPGSTASDGCHYCRTNCDKWGVAWNQRHCHGGSTSTGTSRSQSNKDINWLGWVVGLGAVGGIGYYIAKRKE